VGLASALCILLSGCGQTQGKLLYFLGVGRGKKVEAQFHLTENPIAILIDDASQRIDYPPTFSHLFDELAQELLHNKAAKKIVPRQTLENFRQSLPDFEKRGSREIGELAGAEQVIWIEVQDFLASEEVHDALIAAHFTVTVKILNALEKQNRSRVRLWPMTPKGQVVSVTMTGSEVQIEKTKDAIAKKLSARLAEKIAKFFYDHRLGDFEREE
jgi:hypothetical protein